MKILGYTYHQGTQVCVMKGDSALLVNRKPFFIPDYTTRLLAYPALALRVSRLGKTIAERFAGRYFDAIALALDIQAADLREEACETGAPWTTAVSMDGSFPVGEFGSPEKVGGVRFEINGQTVFVAGTLPQADEVISLISKYMTIRQGDIIYLPLTAKPLTVAKEDSVSAFFEGTDRQNLFCRIK